MCKKSLLDTLISVIVSLNESRLEKPVTCLQIGIDMDITSEQGFRTLKVQLPKESWIQQK